MTISKKPTKKQSRAFGKDIYLLGIDKEGISYWLEAPSWDCLWYWGFGYVETYNNNNAPSKAKDIASHQHVDGFFTDAKKDFKLNMWRTALEWHTYTKYESEKMTTLFTKFYELKETAAKLHSNNWNGTIEELKKVTPSNEAHIKWLHIVTVGIPQVMNDILDILKPGK